MFNNLGARLGAAVLGGALIGGAVHAQPDSKHIQPTISKKTCAQVSGTVNGATCTYEGRGGAVTTLTQIEGGCSIEAGNHTRWFPYRCEEILRKSPLLAKQN